MIEIIEEAGEQTVVSRRRIFWNLNDTESGFEFDVDEAGKLTGASANPDARKNFAYCVNHPELFGDAGIEVHERVIRHRAIGRCRCGESVELGSFTCECPRCGALYNWSGQELADPSQWGEETGEHPADLLRI
jgi:hypothetical protein